MPDDLEEGQEVDTRDLRRMYEAEAQARAEAQSRLADLERREAFRDAGLDPQNKLHRAVMQSYDGELESENVKQYVSDLGVLQPPDTAPPPEQPHVPPDEQASLVAIAEAARDSGTPPPTPDKVQQIRQEMEVAARRGDNAALDRLSVELSRSAGNVTKWDQGGGAESPSIVTTKP